MLGAFIIVCGFLTVLLMLWFFSPWLAGILVIIAGIAGAVFSHLNMHRRQKQLEQRLCDLERTVYELSRSPSTHENNKP
ncbi:MAG: hypothetical protein HFF34_07160 [Oscillospiraceae bacterium]|nr:hypothetical protein [Oscillospiraceae bacterium]MCI9581133.1 hypothetical protein [Oscillospiraceae bacterium]